MTHQVNPFVQVFKNRAKYLVHNAGDLTAFFRIKPELMVDVQIMAQTLRLSISNFENETDTYEIYGPISGVLKLGAALGQTDEGIEYALDMEAGNN